MDVYRITDEEGELLNVLQDISPLAWRRYRARRRRIWREGRFVSEDGSRYPPYVSFRFVHEDVALIYRLHGLVESYRGTVRWALSGRQRETLPGTNWMVAPVRLIEAKEAALAEGLAADQYLAERDPDFGAGAYEDLLRLTQHIKQHLASLKVAEDIS